MKLIEILKIAELGYIVCWLKGDDTEPVWEGYSYSVPWWVADMYIDEDDEEMDKPIDFRDDLGKDCDHKHGFVICLKEEA